MTWRAVLVALLLLALLEIAGFYAEVVADAGDLTAGVPSPGPLAVLVAVAALSALLPRRGRHLRLRRRELIAVFVIVLAGAPLLSLGVLPYLLPHAIYVPYAAGVHPEWESTFLGLMPHWFTPHGSEAITTFFQGESRVPWREWYLPLAAWCSFLLALVGGSTCLLLLLGRQWIVHERLSFPLAQIPLSLVSESAGGEGRLTSVRVLWLGLGISLGARLWNLTASLAPALPALPLNPVPLIGDQSGPAAAFGRMELALWPWLIAVAYLVPKELSFSCWAFWFVRIGLAYIAIAGGATPRSPQSWLGDPGFPAFAFQGFGAMVALSGWALWRARRHLGRAVRAALGAPRDPADQLPYRWILVLLLLCSGWMVTFCLLIGCRVPVAGGLVAALLMYYLMGNWVRAETGLGLLLFPLMVDDLVRAMGQVALRPQELIAISSLRWTYFPGGSDSTQIISGNALEGLKIADSTQLSLRRLLPAMAVAVVLALLVGAYVTLTGYYRYGFLGVRAAGGEGWLASQVTWGAESIPAYLNDPSSLDPRGLAGVAAGGLVAVGLSVLRARFWWWPFHPVGFLASQSWGMHWYWGPFFIGWAAKALVTRYGGLRVYRQTVPLAIGLIAGDLLGKVVWSVHQVAITLGGRL